MKAFLAMAALVATSAHADSAKVFNTTVEFRPSFNYSKATLSSPIFVEAKTEDGRCDFTLALVGIQGGLGADGGTMTGRIERSSCDVGEVGSKPSFVSAYAVGNNEHVTLLPTITVIVVTHAIK